MKKKPTKKTAKKTAKSLTQPSRLSLNGVKKLFDETVRQLRMEIQNSRLEPIPRSVSEIAKEGMQQIEIIKQFLRGMENRVVGLERANGKASSVRDEPRSSVTAKEKDIVLKCTLFPKARLMADLNREIDVTVEIPRGSTVYFATEEGAPRGQEFVRNVTMFEQIEVNENQAGQAMPSEQRPETET